MWCILVALCMNQDRLFDIIDQLEEPRSEEITFDVDPKAVIGGRPGPLTPIATDGIDTVRQFTDTVTPELQRIGAMIVQTRTYRGAASPVYIAHAVNQFTRASKDSVRTWLDASEIDMSRMFGHDIKHTILEFVYVDDCMCYRMWVSTKVTLRVN